MMEHNEYQSIECNESLVKLMEKTGYPMIQENGQRKFGPPPDWKGPAPEKGCEIFVGKIPRDCFEDELVPVFGRIGYLYEFRLMMDFSGTNRGYAFAMYTSVKDARNAISQLNNYEIRKGKHLGVVKSVDNCRLFVGNIPKTKTSEEVTEEMMKVTEGVSHVILYTTPRDKTKNRGFAFVEYESHRAAAMARRKLIPGRIHLWGQQVMVDWAEPEPEVDDDIMLKVKVLYVRNLTEATTEEKIREIFSQIGIDGVEKVKKLRDFAFVHFENRNDAEYAIEKLQGAVVDGCTIEVTWAKPPEKVPNRNFRLRQYNLMGVSAAPYDNNGMSQQQLMRFVTTQPITNQVRGLNASVGFDYNRNRSRSATGIRNSRGFLNGMTYGRAPEFRFFGVPSVPLHATGMQFIPTNNPLALHHHHHLLRTGPFTNTNKYPTQVTIPAYGPINTPTKLCSTSDEAKQYAAQSAIHVLETTFGPYGNSVSSSNLCLLNESNSSSPSGSCFSSPTRTSNYCPSSQSPMCLVTPPSPEYGSKYPLSSFSHMASSDTPNYLTNYYAYVSSLSSDRSRLSAPGFLSNSATATGDFDQLTSGMQPNLFFLSSYYPPLAGTGTGSGSGVGVTGAGGGGGGSSNVNEF